ncbi:hypothetical protein [Cohnella luojiensis]|uniref:Uncharacterized protein n=1 Tax=Cohnella luojiensis TaxID=652876 RepID=A0A4Y8LTF3_9BACL|nr:hypothetical protein [Cohnella luojiensis]TFE24266.1 hypothetical protein E2980_16650 [Cohnella luojiensis]
MSFDTDAWIQFLQDNWVVVAIAILAIIVIMKVVKTVLKWILVVAIIIGIATYGGYSIDDMKDIGNKVSDELGAIGDKVTDEVKKQAIKSMAGEASEATYTENEDGSYSIKSTNIELTGIPNSGEVTVKFHGQSLGTWTMEGAVRDFVVQARASAK